MLYLFSSIVLITAVIFINIRKVKIKKYKFSELKNVFEEIHKK